MLWSWPLYHSSEWENEHEIWIVINNSSQDMGGEGIKAIGQTEVYIRAVSFIYLDIPRPHDHVLRFRSIAL